MRLNRELLYKRHRLSHQQIDDFLGEKESRNYIAEKLEQFAHVKEFLAITKEFSAQAIEFIPLKGPLLSYRIYNDATYRQYNDLDFLIEITSIENALQVFKEKGYVTTAYNLPVDECKRKLLYRHMNEIHLYNTDKEIGIDLHWELFTGGRFIHKQSLQQIIDKNLTTTVFQGQHFNSFSIELELLYLIIHGGLHTWRRLKWLVDIKDFLRRAAFDEATFTSLTKKLDAERLVSLCNELLKIYFPGSRLFPVLEPTSRQSVNFCLHSINIENDEQKRTVTEYLKIFWNNSQAFPGIRYKISIVKQMLFATDLATNKWMPCSNFFFYLVSPFWKISRGFR